MGGDVSPISDTPPSSRFPFPFFPFHPHCIVSLPMILAHMFVSLSLSMRMCLFSRMLPGVAIHSVLVGMEASEPLSRVPFMGHMAVYPSLSLPSICFDVAFVIRCWRVMGNRLIFRMCRFRNIEMVQSQGYGSHIRIWSDLRRSDDSVCRKIFSLASSGGCCIGNVYGRQMMGLVVIFPLVII